MLLTLLKGLHEDLNTAKIRDLTSKVYPAFDNMGLTEMDYVQAERWGKFFKERDNSPIYSMF